ncbi:MAG: amino acid ABC transporter permease [Alphaproteobacteria bacterium]|nr:amino acid ABC transporter permease [Alphaproteobacteria bacterium]
MHYTLQFGQVTGYFPYLLGGAWLSMQLGALSFLIGMAIGLVNATALTFGNRLVRAPVHAFVIFFLNTPLLVQIFFIFFALPEVGIVLNPYEAVLIGMSLNAGAYLTEIQRAGFQSIRRAEIEAAEALGFNLFQLVWYVILPHISKVLFPPLSNQFIIQLMTTSIAAIFGVEELTGRTYNINAQTFRSLEIFSITAGVYVVLTMIASAMLFVIGRKLFRVTAKVF